MTRIFSFVLLLWLAAACGQESANTGEAPAADAAALPDPALQSADFEAFFTGYFAKKTFDDKLSGLAPLVHPTTGVYIIHRPGAIDAIAGGKTIAEAASQVAGLLPKLSGIEGALIKEELPAFDCATEFSKQGYFYQEVSGLKDLSKKYDELVKAGVAEPDQAFLDRLIEADSRTSLLFVSTKESLGLRFAQIEGKWYLIAIDLAQFDCGA